MPKNRSQIFSHLWSFSQVILSVKEFCHVQTHHVKTFGESTTSYTVNPGLQPRIQSATTVSSYSTFLRLKSQRSTSSKQMVLSRLWSKDHWTEMTDSCEINETQVSSHCFTTSDVTSSSTCQLRKLLVTHHAYTLTGCFQSSVTIFHKYWMDWYMDGWMDG